MEKMETKMKMGGGVPIRRAMREMVVGGVITYPIIKMSVVRSTASILGVELDRYYKVEQNREKKVVNVTRER